MSLPAQTQHDSPVQPVTTSFAHHATDSAHAKSGEINASAPAHHKTGLGLLTIAMGALGVVYGDIGTSPLYAANEIFSRLAPTPENVMGVISLVIWVLTLIVSVKYVLFVLRADSDGEGGVFALYSLLARHKVPQVAIFAGLLTMGAGLILGDGVITPAISVISAVEGLKMASQSIEPYIVPITVGILALLFIIQSSGTSKIGKVFGPIILLWFVAITLLGLNQVLRYPMILQALSPIYAIQFLLRVPFLALLTLLGSVMLVVTGGEAMYADMGHFGRTPIRLSWFAIVFPALIINYLGQGAYLLSGQTVLHENIFFSMVPRAVILPMVLLATAATVIASQALISGAFSLITQAISLGLIPYLRVKHTHADHEGQIYVGQINWLLFAGCVALVVIFQSSMRLAAAYGLAVSADMLLTSLAMVMVSKYIWKWSWLQVLGVFVPFVIMESGFLLANTLKLFEGGFIPLLVAAMFALVVKTWRWGRTKIEAKFDHYKTMTIAELIARKQHDEISLPRTVVIMSPTAVTDRETKLPLAKQVFWERYGVLPKHLIFLTVEFLKTPHATSVDRYVITDLYHSDKHGSVQSVQLRFGFMEEPKVEKWLAKLAKHEMIYADQDHRNWLVHAVHERILVQPRTKLWNKLRYYFFSLIARNSKTADQYFSLGNDVPLSIEVIPVNV